MITLRYHEVGYDDETIDLCCTIETMEHAEMWANYLLRHRSDMKRFDYVTVSLAGDLRRGVIRYVGEVDWLEITS